MLRIPVILITGFLGSGKTTWINTLLERHPEKKISIILNEFGNIKLESQFVKAHSGETIELANGCMCCVAKSDIPRVIELILDHSPQTEQIVIEASGLSDPDPIKESLADERLASKVFLQSTICIIDTANFLTTYTDHPLILSQGADADQILLSKLDSCSQEIIKKVEQILTTNLAHTPITHWTKEMDSILLLETEATDQSSGAHHHAHEAMQEYLFSSGRGMNRPELEEIFTHLPTTVYRAKGYSVTDGKKILVQYVAGKLELLEEVSSDTKKLGTRILFLSSPDLEQDIETLVHSIQEKNL